MAKNSLSKFLTGVAVIGAGVALGLAVYNKLDTIKRELDDDEFEDDYDFDDMDDEIIEDTSYVTISTASEDTEEVAAEEETTE